MSVRDLVRAMQIEIRDSDLQPERARELLMKLSAVLGNINDEIRSADAEYASTLLDCLKAHAKANRARIEAETSPQFQRRREARDTKELCAEMISSLKYLLRSVGEEMRLAR